jgi:hypothetical protein
MGDKLYASAINYANGPADTTGVELYSTDTSLSNPVVHSLVKNISVAGPGNLCVLNNKLYFSNYSSFSSPGELWVSDGSSSGTSRLAFMNIIEMNTCGNTLYIVRNDPAKGQELSTLDPADNNVLSHDQNVGINSFVVAPQPEHFMKVNNTLLFTADDGTNGVEIWRTCPALSTQLVSKPAVQSSSIYPNPNTGSFTFNLGSEPAQGEILQIFSVEGQIVYSVALHAQTCEINTFGLSPGIYLYRLKSNPESSGYIVIQ